jgi:hypothetical protein
MVACPLADNTHRYSAPCPSRRCRRVCYHRGHRSSFSDTHALPCCKFPTKNFAEIAFSESANTDHRDCEQTLRISLACVYYDTINTLRKRPLGEMWQQGFCRSNYLVGLHCIPIVASSQSLRIYQPTPRSLGNKTITTLQGLNFFKKNRFLSSLYNYTDYITSCHALMHMLLIA